MYIEPIKPAYAVIAWTGDQWTVVFEKTRCTKSITGYGEFPADKYPLIPVIDFTNNKAAFDAIKFDKCVLDVSFPVCGQETCDLHEYLTFVHNLGVEITNFSEWKTLDDYFNGLE